MKSDNTNIAQGSYLFVVMLLTLLTACGGGSGGSGGGTPPPAGTYTIGGNVSGLNGTGLVLQDNNGDDLAIGANGTFTFGTPVASGATYNVTVKTQPTMIDQTCTASAATGTVSASNVTNVSITCASKFVPRFAYVTNFSDHTISTYRVNASSGQLSSSGYILTGDVNVVAAAGSEPDSVAVDPAGRFAYVANQIGDDISAYNINANTGALTQIDCSTTIAAPAGCSGKDFVAEKTPQSITVDPSGRFVYAVSHVGGANVMADSIDSNTGALVRVGTYPAANPGFSPTSVAVDPSGKFAYVTSAGVNTSGFIRTFAINAGSGALTPVGGAIAAGYNVQSATVDPSGKFVLVANAIDGGGVSVYIIKPTTGALTLVTGSPFVATGGVTSSVAVDPSGKYAYTANSTNDVSAFSIDPAKGVLTQIKCSSGACNGDNFVAGANPDFVTVDPSGKFVHVTNGEGTVSSYAIAGDGSLTALNKVASRAGSTSLAMVKGTTALTYKPKFAYVANGVGSGQIVTGPGSVSSFTIDSSTGGLTRIGTDIATGNSSESLTVDPAGRFVYVANLGSIDISAFTINANTGALTQIVCTAYYQPQYCSAHASNFMGQWSRTIATDPSGRFAYEAALAYGGAVYEYSIDSSTGVLASVGSYAVVAASSPLPVIVAVDPSGKFAYVSSSDGMAVFTINPFTGALTAVPGSPFAPASANFTVDPFGRFLFLADGFWDGSVTVFAINPVSGALTPVPGSPFPAGRQPSSVAVDPSGKYVYTANNFSNDISAFSIDPFSGVLTQINCSSACNGANFAAGTAPVSITVDPSGKFAYVSNYVTDGGGNVSVFSIDAGTGALTKYGADVAAGANPASVVTTGTWQ